MPAAGQFVNNLAPSNFGPDGVYVNQAPAQPVTPVGPATNQLAVIGTGQWGAMNVPTPYANAATGYAAFGPNTALNGAIMRDALAAMPECNAFVGVRIGDGTQAACTIVVTDVNGVPVFTLTAQNNGTLPLGLNAAGVSVNPATAQLTFAAGSFSAGPSVKLVVSFPNANSEQWTIAAAVGAGAYNQALFKANVLAAVNVGTSTSAPSVRWTATAGSSSNPPLLSPTAFVATGGADGATGIVSATYTGTDGITGRTGMYALRGQIPASQYIFAGFSDTTQAQTMATFNRGEGVRAGISFPQGTQYNTAITLRQQNSVSDPTLDACIDWDQMVDAWSGALVYVAPAAKVEGIISSLGYWQSPSNKPYSGAVGIVQTERSIIGPISVPEAAARKANGLMYLTNPIPRGNVWGLPHGKCSDGVSNISDVRASNFIGLSLFTVLGPYVGEPQSQLANDPTRVAARGAVNAFMQSQLVPTPKISGYSNVADLTNNTSTTIAQGFLFDNLAVQTLSGVQFIVVNEQVGTAVQISIQST